MSINRQRIIETLTRFGHSNQDVIVVLSGIKEPQIKQALLLIRNLRAEALKRGIHPAITRAALKFALVADTAAIQEQGHDLLFYDRLSELLMVQWIERMGL